MNNKVEQKIKHALQEALAKINIDVDVDKIPVQKSSDSQFGDHTSTIAMQLASKIKKNPFHIAEQIKDNLNMPEEISKIETVKPGFVNFWISDKEFVQNSAKLIKTIVQNSEKYGQSAILKDKRIMVEYAHPNPFKVVHVGHLRNIVLGESIIRLIESQGAEVIRTNYQGDVGLHIAKSIWGLLKVDPKDYPETIDERVELLGKAYSKGAIAYKEDEEARAAIVEINKKIYSKVDPKINELVEMGKEWSFARFHRLAERLYSTFDREYMESETLDTCMKYIEEAVEKGILKKDDGAVIFDGEPYGLHTRVFLNSEGLPTYEGKELGLAFKEFTDFGELDFCIHNVAVEQISFFKVTFKVEELLSPELFKDKQYHNPYELVDLKGGKMSSRLGNIVSADDVLDTAHAELKKVVDERSIEIDDEDLEKLAVASVKYSFLRISPFKKLAFSFEDSLNFEGDSGPYIEYTYARANSVLDKVEKLEDMLQDINYTDVAQQFVDDQAEDLVKLVSEFPRVVQSASEKYMPNYVTKFLFDLCTEFNKFYNAHSILKADSEEERKARILLTWLVALVIKKGLYYLGIKTVKKM